LTTLLLVAVVAPQLLPPLARGRAAVNGRTASGTTSGEMRRKTFRPHHPPAHSLGGSARNRPPVFTAIGGEYALEQHERCLRRRRPSAFVEPSFAALPRPSFRRATPLMTRRTTPCYTVFPALRWPGDIPVAHPGLRRRTAVSGAGRVSRFAVLLPGYGVARRSIAHTSRAEVCRRHNHSTLPNGASTQRRRLVSTAHGGQLPPSTLYASVRFRTLLQVWPVHKCTLSYAN
jgi:hypothetical protein